MVIIVIMCYITFMKYFHCSFLFHYNNGETELFLVFNGNKMFKLFFCKIVQIFNSFAYIMRLVHVYTYSVLFFWGGRGKATTRA